MPFASSLDIRAVEPVQPCRHCGQHPSDPRKAVVTPHGSFCCRGCEAVFSILRTHQLEAYYACEVPPGVPQTSVVRRDRARFAALDDPAVAARMIAYDDGRVARAAFAVPTVHCASCVWLLEQLWRLDAGVLRSEVDLLRRCVHVEFRPGVTSLRAIAERLASLGYEPAITSETGPPGGGSPNRRLYLQLGLAGFAFGNMMLFSIPRYANGAPLDDGFQRLFDGLNVLFALPVLFYSASDYFRSAWQAVRGRAMTLDVPIAIGLSALVGRSMVDIATARGEGYLDSFAGLVFFLLIARLFGRKVFERIAFDRTFRSFLPLSVRVHRRGGPAAVPLDEVRIGDRIEIRPHEVVPADGVLLDASAEIDYAFTTGEARPVAVTRGEIVRAGGRAATHALRLRVVREVSHSYLASLWRNPAFARRKARWLTGVNARFGAWFTAGATGLAAAGAIAWWPDASASAEVFTAVLIIACPCALTLAAPITLGTAMGLLGTRGFYLKEPSVALDLSRIDTVAFDKTGTLTTAAARPIVEVHGLSDTAWALVRRLAAESVHPASRAIAAAVRADASDGRRGEGSRANDVPRPRNVRAVAGKGIAGSVAGEWVAIGTPAFVSAETDLPPDGPDDCTHVAAGLERGWIRLSTAVRPGIEAAAAELSRVHELCLLSGDHPDERSRWERFFGARMRFRQSPEDKLAYIEQVRAAGRRVLMVGDGLNDAGALAAADVGVAVSDETACIAPACDAVIDGHRLAALPAFLRYARRARHVLLLCFAVSVLYNVVGLTLALSGVLTPLAAAVLMPVSSMTVVGVGAGAMRLSARMLPS